MAFKEDSRVKIPAILHLCRLGYGYLSLKDAVIDERTNIFPALFASSLSQLNPEASSDDINRAFQDITLLLDYEDLGKAFYERLTQNHGVKLIDFENFENNRFHVVTELTCKNGEDEFRPDITVLINGMPLSFIEVKKPNNRDGVIAERNRINWRLQQPHFRRFANITQLMLFSNNMEYENGSPEPIQGAFYGTSAYGDVKFHYFREEEALDLNQILAPEDPTTEHRVLTDNNLIGIRHSSEYVTNKCPDTPTNRVLTSHSSGSAQPQLPIGSLRNIVIPFFDIKDQREIASVLSILDAKISLNHRINSELEGMAKLLYDYWFVQFDFPMSAAQAAAHGNPRLAGQPYQSSGGQMTYHPTLKREIPAGWNSSTLGEMFNLYQPQTITEKDLKADGDYFVYGANGIVGKYDRFNHEASKIALTCRGSTCGNLTRTMPFSWITGNAMVMDPKDSTLDIEYIYNVAKASGIDAIITGSGQPQITRNNLEGVKTILPDSSTVKRYQDFAAPITKQRFALEQQNQHLTALRDWLLPMLMNGQVTDSSS